MDSRRNFKLQWAKSSKHLHTLKFIPKCVATKELIAMSCYPRVSWVWILALRPGSSNVCSVGKRSSTNTTSKSISASTAVRQNNIKTFILTQQFAIVSTASLTRTYHTTMKLYQMYFVDNKQVKIIHNKTVMKKCWLYYQPTPAIFD